jgi:glycerate dehydrogenase
MNVLVAEHRGVATRPGRVAFADVIQEADVLSIHCPLSVHTQGLIDHTVLSAMKPDAILINTARGDIVVERDLADALRKGVIAGAAIDTLSVEPPPPDHVLLAPDIPNLIVTPHNAWASRTARQTAMDQVARVITAFVAGTAINRVV